MVPMVDDLLRKNPATPVARTPRATPPDDCDLPLLAATFDLPKAPDWASLLDDGVHPALILGAERRTGGRR